jgi:hypothetical protein
MSRRRWGLIVAVIVVVSCGVGYGLRSAFPPYPAFSTPVVMDEALWRDMISGPPLAGFFAVIAACVAFMPAYRSGRIAQETAARELWWKRAEWALTQAASTDDVDREVAGRALLALSREANRVEFDMIVATMESLQAAATAVDSGSETAEDGVWITFKRRLPWTKSG